MIAEENNVLLLGASDGRHLFETISTYNNEEFPKLTFWYVLKNVSRMYTFSCIV